MKSVMIWVFLLLLCRCETDESPSNFKWLQKFDAETQKKIFKIAKENDLTIKALLGFRYSNSNFSTGGKFNQAFFHKFGKQTVFSLKRKARSIPGSSVIKLYLLDKKERILDSFSIVVSSRRASDILLEEEERGLLIGFYSELDSFFTIWVFKNHASVPIGVFLNDREKHQNFFHVLAYQDKLHFVAHPTRVSSGTPLLPRIRKKKKIFLQ